MDNSANMDNWAKMKIIWQKWLYLENFNNGLICKVRINMYNRVNMDIRTNRAKMGNKANMDN